MAIFLTSKPCQSRQDVDEFIGFSAIAQREDNVPIANYAEITVKSVERIEDDGR